MKKMMNILLIFLLISVIALPAYAQSETTVPSDAELLELFDYAMNAPEDEIEDVIAKLGKYFLAVPTQFVQLLSTKPQEVQDKVLNDILTEHYVYYYGGNPAFPEAVASVTLTDDDNEAAHSLLSKLEALVAVFWGSDPTLQELFQLYPNFDGTIKAEIVYELCGAFFEDPAEFIRLLAEEDTATYQQITEELPDSMYNHAHPSSYSLFPDAVLSIELTDEDSEIAWYILEAFKAKVDEYWNPKTGDPVGIAAAVMVLCGIGGGILICKKRLI